MDNTIIFFFGLIRIQIDAGGKQYHWNQ